MRLASCSSCDGFLPPAATRCPHCGATPTPARPRSGLRSVLARVLLRIGGGSAFAVTLMACYGAGAMPDACPDVDGDGYFPGCYADDGVTCDADDRYCDCDDSDPATSPGAIDHPGDGLDTDCSGADGPGGPGWGPDAGPPLEDADDPPDAYVADAPDASVAPDAAPN